MDSVSDPVCINGEENGEEWTEPANEELDEDIFSYLSNEEQECLKYLMDTIDSLEADMVADDQEERTGGAQETETLTGRALFTGGPRHRLPEWLRASDEQVFIPHVKFSNWTDVSSFLSPCSGP
ncbi:UNVERIFIED_CONTAM: hypothetical protein FKN15_030273 [Acipenser sinensis]